MNPRIKAIFEKYISKEHQVFLASSDPIGINIELSRETYFEDPKHPNQLNFELMAIDGGKALGAKLKEIWKNDPILLEMVSDLEELAEDMRKQEKHQAAELDSFIYVMY